MKAYPRRSLAEHVPQTIEEVYTIDVPEGFVLTEDYSTETCIDLIYSNGEQYINFTQEVLSSFNMNIDNETTTMEILIIDGIEYQFINYENGCQYGMIWENYGYVFDITSNINKESFMELCKSTKLK